jgi:hypothetical protein
MAKAPTAARVSLRKALRGIRWVTRKLQSQVVPPNKPPEGGAVPLPPHSPILPRASDSPLANWPPVRKRSTPSSTFSTSYARAESEVPSANWPPKLEAHSFPFVTRARKTIPFFTRARKVGSQTPDMTTAASLRPDSRPGNVFRANGRAHHRYCLTAP